MMSVINNIKQSYLHIPYTWEHKIAVAKLAKKFTGRVSLRILLHDADKLIGYTLFPFLTLHQHKVIHRKICKHHHYDDIANLSYPVLEEIVLDWESARYTKPDKPQTAREWCVHKRMNCYPYLSPIFDKWGI